MFACFPDAFDSFEFAAVTGSSVRVRSRPSLDGEVLATVSYEIVRPFFEKEAKVSMINDEKWPWLKVQLHDGTYGYIFGKYVRSSIDYRVGFEKKSEGWKIIFFIAGD